MKTNKVWSKPCFVYFTLTIIFIQTVENSSPRNTPTTLHQSPISLLSRSYALNDYLKKLLQQCKMQGLKTNKQCLAASMRCEESESRWRKVERKSRNIGSGHYRPIRSVEVLLLCCWCWRNAVKLRLAAAVLYTFASIDSWGMDVS